MPVNRALSKDLKLAGILVISFLSGDLLQSSTYLIFSESLFHALHTALAHRSLAEPTSALRRSSTAPSPRATGSKLAMSQAPEPTTASALDK